MFHVCCVNSFFVLYCFLFLFLFKVLLLLILNSFQKVILSIFCIGFYLFAHLNLFSADMFIHVCLFVFFLYMCCFFMFANLLFDFVLFCFNYL